MNITPETRRVRLANEYAAMLNFKQSCPWITWEVASGVAPWVTEYRLTLNVPTVLTSHWIRRDSHELSVKLPPAYPEVPPDVVMLTRPAPYHPNWWDDGRWCQGSLETWDIGTELVDHLYRMARTLVFDLEVSNPESATDKEKSRWYCEMRSQGRFPLARLASPQRAEDDGFIVLSVSGTSAEDDFKFL